VAFSIARLPVPSEPTLWLQDVAWLRGPDQAVSRGDALIGADGLLLALGDRVGREAEAAGLAPRPAADWWLAPSLVDPHSALEQPLLGRAETLASFGDAAVSGGYGQVALLPWADVPRDHPDTLQPPPQGPDPALTIHPWASLCRGGQDAAAPVDLAPHAELLNAGAIGLAATAELPPLALLERSLQLGEMGDHPVLVAPRQRSLSGGGLVRERVEALRAGWSVDPSSSETLPLGTLLQLQQHHPQRRLVAINISTAEAVEMLRHSPTRLAATVHWWHLIHDSGNLHPTAPGWRLEPPLGGPADRTALRQALREGLIDAIAVHHQALDAEEQLLPLELRRPGLAGHGLVLPLLWQALVEEAGWSAQQLWHALCWGPARLLGLPANTLEAGSRHWVLFDPKARWVWGAQAQMSRAANQPLAPGSLVAGQVRAGGLIPRARWQLS